MKSLTNGFPRVSGSGILFEADEFRIIDLCPSSDSVAKTCQDEELEEEHQVQLELGLEDLHGDGRVELKLHGHHQSRNPPNGQEEPSDWLE